MLCKTGNLDTIYVYLALKAKSFPAVQDEIDSNKKGNISHCSILHRKAFMFFYGKNEKGRQAGKLYEY